MDSAPEVAASVWRKDDEMMLKFSPCIEMLFTDLPFLERIEQVAKLGFGAFEFWGWNNKDLPGILRKCEEVGIKVAVFGISPREGHTAPIIDPRRRGEFLEAVRASVDVAAELGTKTLIVTTGNEIPELSRGEQRESIIAALTEAAPIVEASGITLVLEPLNTLVDHPGYFLSSSKEAFSIVGEIGSPNVKILYDIYHQQIMEGNVISTIETNIDKIGHFHVADVPGRHEPGTGELNYRNIFKHIERSGYQGYVGLEFRPSGPSAESLKEVLEIAGSR